MAEHKLERELRRFFFALAPIFVRPECRKSSHSGTGILATQAMVNQNIDSFNFLLSLEPLDWSPLLFVWLTVLHLWEVLSIISPYYRIYS